jgi:hypothetical protein
LIHFNSFNHLVYNISLRFGNRLCFFSSDIACNFSSVLGRSGHGASCGWSKFTLGNWNSYPFILKTSIIIIYNLFWSNSSHFKVWRSDQRMEGLDLWVNIDSGQYVFRWSLENIIPCQSFVPSVYKWFAIGPSYMFPSISSCPCESVLPGSMVVMHSECVIIIS